MGGSQRRKREAAVAALLTSPTLETASAKAGISLATLKRWMLEPEFLAAYRSAREEIVDRTTSLLLNLNSAAIMTLGQNLSADRAADSTRAAAIILEQSFRGMELGQLASEVAELRRIVETLQKREKLRVV